MSITEIEEQLKQSEKLTRSKLNAHFDQLMMSCQQLQKFVSDSTLFLPSYDVKRSQEEVTRLLSLVNESRTKVLPKKKFAFTSRQKEASNSCSTQQSNAAETQENKKQASSFVNFTGFRNCQNEHLELQPSIASHQDIVLSDLANCSVKIYGTPTTVHIDKLVNCWVFCGPTMTSVFIDNCEKSTMLLACQQLRLHKSQECKMYIHVSSKAIIEDCSKIGFGPYNWNYDMIAEHFKLAGLDGSHNNWNEVKDFNWLSATEHSPNWYAIADEDMVLQWDP